MNRRTKPRNTSSTQAINQAIISFTFGGAAFDIDCHINGIQPNTRIFNALEAHLFTPLYDLDHNCYQFIPIEFWQRELPMLLQHQAH